MASFKEAYPRLREQGAQVVGISADTLDSHARFAASLGGLPFPLLSDATCQAISAYGVLNEKGSGARRSVFVVDRDGKLIYANERFEVGKLVHMEAVLRAVGADGLSRDVATG